MATQNRKSPGYDTSTNVEDPQPKSIKYFLKAPGPGLITGASDDDPSGIGTYAAAGAQRGYAMLWTALSLMAGR